MGNKKSRDTIPSDQLTHLLEHSNYNKKEIKQIYKKFCQFVTDGQMTKSQFVDIYINCSTNKNITAIAEHIFRACDTDENHQIDFVEFVSCLSITTRGTLMEQIKWIFDLYDINRDGEIELEEIQEILSAVESLGVKNDNPSFIIDRFNEMDEDKNGKLSQTEFVNGCLEDTSLLKAIGLMNG